MLFKLWTGQSEERGVQMTCDVYILQVSIPGCLALPGLTPGVFI